MMKQEKAASALPLGKEVTHGEFTGHRKGLSRRIKGRYRFCLLYTSNEEEYEYRILNVKLTNKPIASLAEELLNPQQFEMFKVYLPVSYTHLDVYKRQE